MTSVVANRGQPSRISIVGATGSGKSHLARELARKTDLPVHELDTVRRDVGLDSGEGFVRSVERIAAGDKWIIDGHYRDVRHLVWRRADTVLWLNYPLGLIAARLLRRFAAGRRSGDREKKDAAVPPATRAGWKRRLGRLARTLRERSEYGRLLRSAEYRQLRVVELKSVSATEDWLRRLDG